MKVAWAAIASPAPAMSRAPAVTSIETVAPYGSGDAGVKTRTVSFSAQLTAPAIALPPTLTVTARAVDRRSITLLKRTEIGAARSTFFASAAGRKRTTAGAEAVRTDSVIASSGRPSVSRTPATWSR